MLLFRERPDQEILFLIDELIDDEKVKKAKEIKLTKFKYVLPDKKENPVERFTPRLECSNEPSLSKAVQKKLTMPSPSTSNQSIWS